MGESVRSLDSLPTITVGADFAIHRGAILAQAEREHGPIFHVLDHLNRKWLYLVGPEANRMVMLTHHHDLSHGEGWERLTGAIQTLGEGLLFLDGEAHRLIRTAVSPAFSGSAIGDVAGTINQIIEKHVESWRGRVSVDLYEEVYRITFELSAVVLVGLKEERSIKDLMRLFHELVSLDLRGTEETRSPISNVRARRNEIRGELIDLLRTVANRKQLGTGSTPLDLIAASSDVDGVAISDEALVAHANAFLIAGHVTTSSLCAFLLYQIASDQTLQERVAAEVSRMLEPSGCFNHRQINGSPLITDLIKEAQRLFPPVSELPRVATADLTFFGYLIPKGTTLLCSVSGTHMSAKVFRDPERFDHTRFAEPQSEPWSLVGFSGGPRRCIGANMAITEVGLIIAHVLNRYALEPKNESEPVPVYSPFLAPWGGIAVRLSDR
ncbi:cytochrome P450 [Mesorhizobium sp. M0772]|uniref:cytochrome P450 n=1 Tax=Mesorhizobium sp. M0772 TaxID=2956998 RepID=UPI003337E03D